MSGYINCQCRDCFDIAIANENETALCNDCEEAGCQPDQECERHDAYDVDSE